MEAKASLARQKKEFEEKQKKELAKIKRKFIKKQELFEKNLQKIEKTKFKWRVYLRHVFEPY